jgi:hypothetical protein
MGPLKATHHSTRVYGAGRGPGRGSGFRGRKALTGYVRDSPREKPPSRPSNPETGVTPPRER